MRIGGRDRAVRYIGIDTPERDEPCYAEAARANRDLAGDRVRLVFDADREDRYGRLLAYVYSADGRVFVNERLVRDGLARPLRIAPNVRFARRFERLARKTGRGRRGCGRVP